MDRRFAQEVIDIRDELIDKVREAQLNQSRHEAEVTRQLIDGGHTDFLKIDWGRLSRHAR